MLSPKNKGRLLLAGILACFLIVVLIAIGNGIYQTAPGPVVDYASVSRYNGKKVTMQGELGEIASTIAVNEGTDVIDYFNEYFFYPEAGNKSEFIYLRFKPSDFQTLTSGQRIQVIGQVIVEKDNSIHIEVFRLNPLSGK